MSKAATKPATDDTAPAGVRLTKKGREAITKEALEAPDSTSGKRIKSFLERIERLEAEKAGLAEDIKEVYAEAKGTGFEEKILRKIIALRKMAIEKRREEDELLNLYMNAIGME